MRATRNNEESHRESGINMTEVLYETMPRCDELMSNCWWRNSDRNCCEIFEVQRTEYGFCYSFNSEVAEPSLLQTPRGDRQSESRPRKASGYGEWSGVKVTIHLGNITKPPDSGKYRDDFDAIFYVDRRATFDLSPMLHEKPKKCFEIMRIERVKRSDLLTLVSAQKESDRLK